MSKQSFVKAGNADVATICYSKIKVIIKRRHGKLLLLANEILRHHKKFKWLYRNKVTTFEEALIWAAAGWGRGFFEPDKWWRRWWKIENWKAREQERLEEPRDGRVGRRAVPGPGRLHAGVYEGREL